VISIAQCHRTIIGALALAEAFSQLSNLQKVNLGDCLIGTKGAIAIAKVKIKQMSFGERLLIKMLIKGSGET